MIGVVKSWVDAFPTPNTGKIVVLESLTNTGPVAITMPQMEISFDWLSVINAIGVVIGIFFIVIILGLKKGKKTTKILLAGFIFSLCMVILSFLLRDTNTYLEYPHLIGILPPFFFLLGPLLFLYVKALIFAKFEFRIQYYLHFLPFILNLVYGIPFFLRSAEYKYDLYMNLSIYINLDFHIFFILRFLQLFIYFFFVVKLLKIHSRDIRDRCSAIEKIRLKWLWYLVFALLADLLAHVSFYFFRDYGHNISPALGDILSVLEVSIVIFVAYKGLVQQDIFTDSELPETISKYEKSPLTADLKRRYLKILLENMEKERPYLDPNITLGEIAGDIGLNPNYLSQIINESLNRNFYEFINEYRIKEAIDLLENPKLRITNMLEIAFRVGFNTKSTFYRFFKNVLVLASTVE